MKNNNSTTIIEQIKVNKLDGILLDNNYTLIDVRGPEGIKKQGNIPGAFNIPFDSIDKSIDKNQEGFNPIFNHKGPYLFCCTGGVMSYMAAIKAQEKGINNVFNLEGGHSAWLKLKEASIA